MFSVERCGTTGRKCCGPQFLFLIIASSTPGLWAKFLAAYSNSGSSACCRFSASTKFWMGKERMDSRARAATSSSESSASTESTSAKSGAATCTPPVHTASFSSRLPRPSRKPRRFSALSVSTGRPPRVFGSQHDCTGGGGCAEWRQALPVQFQQHRRRVRHRHFKPVVCEKVAAFPRGHPRLKSCSSICHHAHVSSFCRRNQKIEHRSRGVGCGLRSTKLCGDGNCHRLCLRRQAHHRR